MANEFIDNIYDKLTGQSGGQQKISDYSANENVRKFLDVLGQAEGAGYDTIVGGSKFDDFGSHPGVVGLRTKSGPSTAAGKYQITKTTYDDFAPKLGINDFSPESQDRLAMAIMEKENALGDVERGDFDSAIKKLGNRWASLPSSKYGQPTRSDAWMRERLGDSTKSDKEAFSAAFNAPKKMDWRDEDGASALIAMGREGANPVVGGAITDDQAKAKESPGFWSDIKNTLNIGFQSIALDAREVANKTLGSGFVDFVDNIDGIIHGKKSEELIKGNIERAKSGLSPEMTEAMGKSWYDDETGSMGSAWSDPRAYIGGLTQSLPGTVVTMIPGGVLAKGMYATRMAAAAAAAQEGGLVGTAAKQFLAKQATTEAARAASAAQISGTFLEGLQGGAQASREVRDAIMAMDEKTLSQSDAMKSMMSQGMSFEDAKRNLANDSSTQAMVTAGVITGAFGGMGDRVLAKAVTTGIKGNVLTRFAKGAAGEGLFEEFPQSYGSKVSQNLAMQNADPNIRATEGAMNEGLGGLAVGSFMGGTMAAPFKDHSPDSPAPEKKKDSPLTNAANAAISAQQEQVPKEDPFASLVAPLSERLNDRSFYQSVRDNPNLGPDALSDILASYRIATNTDVDPQQRQDAVNRLTNFFSAFDNNPNFTLGSNSSNQQASNLPAVVGQNGSTAVGFADPSIGAIDGEASRVAPNVQQQRIGQSIPALATDERAKKLAEAEYEAAYQDLVKAEQLGASDEILMQKQIAMRNAEARMREIAQAIDANRIAETAKKRDSVLNDVLANVQPGQNPLRAFDRALKQAGFTDTAFTDAEKAKIAQWQALNQTLNQENEQEAAPVAPNELDASSLGIKEKRVAEQQQTPSGRKLQQVDELMAAGYVRKGDKLVDPVSKKVIQLAPAQIARAKRNEEKQRESAQSIERSSEGESGNAIGSNGNDGAVPEALQGQADVGATEDVATGETGSVVQQAESVPDAGLANSDVTGEQNASEPEQVVEETSQANDEEVGIEQGSASQVTEPSKNPRLMFNAQGEVVEVEALHDLKIDSLPGILLFTRQQSDGKFGIVEDRTGLGVFSNAETEQAAIDGFSAFVERAGADVVAEKIASKPGVQAKEAKVETNEGSLDFVQSGFEIYPTKMRVAGEVKDYWAVQTEENRVAGRRGFGDTLHETKEQAIDQADQNKRRSEMAEKSKAEEAAEKAAIEERKAADKADNMGGFLDGLPPNRQALIKKTLEKKWNLDGKQVTTREYIEQKAASGDLRVSTYEEDRIKPMSRMAFNRADQKTQDAHEKKVREGGKKTVYEVNGFDLGKNAYDYASFLLSKKQTQPNADIDAEAKQEAAAVSTQKNDSQWDIPEGWAGLSRGILTNKDPVFGGIVDQEFVSKKWFAISNKDGIDPLEGFDTRAEALQALKDATAEKEAKSVDSDMDALKAEMGQAIGELASILGVKSNLTPEEETKIIPVMSKIFRIAAKMGYVKFKDAARYVYDQIKAIGGHELANKLSIDNLQAGYVNIAKEFGGDKKEALDFDSIDDLLAEREAMNERIAQAEEKTAVNPTEAQKESGNYVKGKFPWRGMTIAIETPKGSDRSGVGEDGQPWKITAPVSYGYFLGTNAADNENLDVYVGPTPESDKVFIVNQTKVDSTKFDEHKVMAGFGSVEEAKKAYEDSFSDGFASRVFGSISGPYSVDEFKSNLEKLEKAKPLDDRIIEKSARLEEKPIDPDVAALSMIDDQLSLAKQLLSCVSGG